MPCPYFEPQQVAASPQYTHIRLPLIEEYDGVCRAGANPVPIPAEKRFQQCNHGYSRRACPLFPAEDARSGIRYSVLNSNESSLEIICIEERDYEPVRWFKAQYVMAESRLEPPPNDDIMRAQALAFCRSYIKKFAASLSPIHVELQPK